VQMSKVELELE